MARLLKVLLVSISFLAVLIPHSINAQGICGCGQNNISQCIVQDNNCEGGYLPICTNNAQCNTSCECQLIEDTPDGPKNPTLGCGGGEINSAVGCIPVDPPNALAAYILKRAMGIVGGITLIMIAIAGFQIMTSQGDPARIQGGKNLLTAAISALLLLIFSAFILRVVGVDILGIPFFGT